MRTANVVTMKSDLERIVALAVDTERWPEILPHYRWVTRLSGTDDHKTVEMAARRGVIPVRWRATQDVERGGATPIIRFVHVWGVTKGMDVAWTFEPDGDFVRVTIDHDFQPRWPLVGRPIADGIIGPHFVGAIAGRTLETIRGIVEGRNERFDPDGRVRS